MPINFEEEQVNLVWAARVTCEDVAGDGQEMYWCGPSSRTSGFTFDLGGGLGWAFEPRGGQISRRRDLGSLKNNIIIPTRLGLQIQLGSEDAALRTLALTGKWAGYSMSVWRVELDDEGKVLNQEIIFKGRIAKRTVKFDRLEIIGGSRFIGLHLPWPMGRPIDSSLFTDTTDGVTSGSDTSVGNSNGGTFHPSSPALREGDVGKYIPLVFGDGQAVGSGLHGFVWRRALYVGRNRIDSHDGTGPVSPAYSYFFFVDHRTGTGSDDSVWVDQVRHEAPDTNAKPHLQAAAQNSGGTPGSGTGTGTQLVPKAGSTDSLGLMTVYEVLDDTAGIGPEGTYVRIDSEFDITMDGEAEPQCFVRMSGRNRGTWDTAWNSAPDPHITSGAVRVLKRSTTPPADADWQIIRDVFTDSQLLNLGASSDVFETGNLSAFDTSAPTGVVTGDRWRRFGCCVPLEPTASPPTVREVLQDLLYQVGADVCEVYETAKDDLRLRFMRRRPNPAEEGVDHLLLEGEFLTGERSVVTRWRVEDDPNNFAATDVTFSTPDLYVDPLVVGSAAFNVPEGAADDIDRELAYSFSFSDNSYRSSRDDEDVVVTDAGRFWVALEELDGGGGVREGAQFIAEARQQHIMETECVGGFRWMRFDPGDTVQFLAEGLDSLPTGHIRGMVEKIGDEVSVDLRIVHASFFPSADEAGGGGGGD